MGLRRRHERLLGRDLGRWSEVRPVAHGWNCLSRKPALIEGLMWGSASRNCDLIPT